MTVIVFQKMHDHKPSWKMVIASGEFLKIWAPVENKDALFNRWIYDVSDWSSGYNS